MTKSKFVKGFKKYFSVEIAIEYKACLYFYAIVFFYCVCRALQGNFQASVLHMCEIILTTYLMGYLQVYLLQNFDEAETLGKREVLYILICTTIYTGASYLFGWFGRSLIPTLVFFGFIGFAYWCVYLINKIKRNIDTENLNDMLDKYKKAGNFMRVVSDVAETRTEKAGTEAEKAGAEAGTGADKTGAEAEEAGMEADKAGAEAGMEEDKVGTEADKAGTEVGKAGAEAGTEANKAGTEADKAGTEAGKAGAEAGTEANKAGTEAMKRRGEGSNEQ